MAQDPRDKRIEELEAKLDAALKTITELREENERLKEQLRASSRNSSKPPSSDSPNVEKPSKPPTGRKPGGQPGHKRHERAMFPAEKVTTRVVCKPTRCEECGSKLHGTDPNPDRHQVADLPRVEPRVTEYEIHTLGCGCGAHTKGTLPKDAPRGSFGPTVVATIALMLGVWGLSRRAVVDAMGELFGLPISLGGVIGCQKIATHAMAAPHQQAVAQVEQAPVKYADETGWSERNVYMCLWTIVTSKATVFRIHAERSRDAVMELFKTVVGILVSDRYSVYDSWPTHLHQFCWAHLARLFVKWSERPGDAKLGRKLIKEKDLLFQWWHRIRDGTMKRSTLQRHVRKLRTRILALLVKAAASSCAKTRRTAQRLLESQHALFTFVFVEGVEPTNNTAERALRWAVILRKTSFGTQSEHGSRFIERILTVHMTLRQHRKNAYAYIVAGCRDHMAGRPVANLIAACGP